MESENIKLRQEYEVKKYKEKEKKEKEKLMGVCMKETPIDNQVSKLISTFGNDHNEIITNRHILTSSNQKAIIIQKHNMFK